MTEAELAVVKPQKKEQQGLLAILGTDTTVHSPKSLSFFFFFFSLFILHWGIAVWGFPDSSVGKESTFNVGDLGLIPGWEDPLEKGKATHSSILVWRILWTLWGRKESDTTEQLSHFTQKMNSAVIVSGEQPRGPSHAHMWVHCAPSPSPINTKQSSQSSAAGPCW